MHNELHSTSPKSSLRDLKFVIAEFLLSIATSEETNDNAAGPPNDQVIMKAKAAEVTETWQSKLRPPIHYMPEAANDSFLSKRLVISKMVLEDCPKCQDVFYPLHSGLSPPLA